MYIIGMGRLFLFFCLLAAAALTGCGFIDTDHTTINGKSWCQDSIDTDRACRTGKWIEVEGGITCTSWGDESCIRKSPYSSSSQMPQL